MIGLWSAVALGGVSFEQPPQAGEPTVIAVVDAAGNPRRGETVRVTHRPGTAHARERAIGITDGRGRVAWTPEEGGTASLRAGDEVLALRVGWTGLPAGTLTLLGLLGLAALGALGHGLTRSRPRLRGAR